MQSMEYFGVFKKEESKPIYVDIEWYICLYWIRKIMNNTYSMIPFM